MIKLDQNSAGPSEHALTVFAFMLLYRHLLIKLVSIVLSGPLEEPLNHHMIADSIRSPEPLTRRFVSMM